MRKTVAKRMIVNVLQLILPLLFLLYFDHYMTLKEAAHTEDISFGGLLGHVLVYFLLLLLFVYAAVNSYQNEKGVIPGVVGWIEAVVLWVLPLTFLWENRIFIRIKGYLIDYLHVYGIIVLLYSIHVLYIWRLHCRKYFEK